MQRGEATPPLWRDRELLADRLASAPGVVLALDFDGTLAPIVENPEAATMRADVRGALVALAARHTVETAVVSGRSLADLRDRVGIDGVDYAGNHGLERQLGEGTRRPPDADRWQATIEDATRLLTRELTDVPGIRIENKGLTATVHVRSVPEEYHEAVQQSIESVLATLDDTLERREGKEIHELSPPIEWDKGRAVRRLLSTAPDDWLAIYVGDDVTDEDAFGTLAALERPSLTVLVGDREETVADYRVETPADVADLLACIDERHG